MKAAVAGHAAIGLLVDESIEKDRVAVFCSMLFARRVFWSRGQPDRCSLCWQVYFGMT